MYRLLTWLAFVGFIVSFGLWGIGDGARYGFYAGGFILAMFGFACVDLSGKLPR